MILASRQVIESVDSAWYWITGISLILFIGIMGCLIGFVMKYHRTKHPKAEHIPGNFKLEVIWTVLPTLLSVWLFFIGLEGFQLMRNPPKDAYEINVIARQWSWEFQYPEEGVSSSELYVPVNQPVKLNLSTPIDDVIHSFYLPDFRVKEDCVPGLDTYVWFEADEVTDPKHPHTIFCTEFCGRDHSRMYTWMHVLPREDFGKWLDKAIAKRYEPVLTEPALDPTSKQITDLNAEGVFNTYCASCHGRGGEGGLVEGARDFRSAQGWKKGMKITDIYETLTNGLEGTQMRAFNNLPPWTRIALAHYVQSFYKGPDMPETTKADMDALIEKYQLKDQKAPSRKFPIEEAMQEMAKRSR